MDPQVAVALLATIAQISGTVLAIYIAVVIFILQDETLARLILKDGKLGATFILLGPAFTWAFVTTLAIIELLTLDLEKPYSDFVAFAVVITFGVALFLMVVRFWSLISAKKSLYARE